MGAFRGFWGGSGNQGDTGGQAPVDMTVTGEGCQPITDLAWKKKENKYLGQSSLSEREVSIQKYMDSKGTSLEQFNQKFPDNEKHLGLENVSRAIIECQKLIYIRICFNLSTHCFIALIKFESQMLNR